MKRRRLALAALVCAACGVLSPEEQLLRRFFEASRLYDTTTVAALAAVTFNPRTDGVVRDFAIEDVAEEGSSKLVTIRAAIRQLDGGTTERALIVTMVRKDDRWFIVRVE